MKRSSTFILTLSFPQSSTFLTWRGSPTTIAISYLFMVHKFAPVATGQQLTVIYLDECAFLMHTLNTWLHSEKSACVYWN